MIKRIIFIAVAAFLIIAQFFQIDKTNPPLNPGLDFLAAEMPNGEVGALFRTACYDCHSNETVYPWYTSVAPLSWWIKNHIDEGRHDLNYSVWGDYSEEKKAHKIEESIEMIENKEMPLLSYWTVHWDAKLTEEERKAMADWLRGLE